MHCRNTPLGCMLSLAYMQAQELKAQIKFGSFCPFLLQQRPRRIGLAPASFQHAEMAGRCTAAVHRCMWQLNMYRHLNHCDHLHQLPWLSNPDTHCAFSSLTALTPAKNAQAAGIGLSLDATQMQGHTPLMPISMSLLISREELACHLLQFDHKVFWRPHAHIFVHLSQAFMSPGAICIKRDCNGSLPEL